MNPASELCYILKKARRHERFSSCFLALEVNVRQGFFLLFFDLVCLIIFIKESRLWLKHKFRLYIARTLALQPQRFMFRDLDVVGWPQNGKLIIWRPQGARISLDSEHKWVFAACTFVNWRFVSVVKSNHFLTEHPLTSLQNQSNHPLFDSLSDLGSCGAIHEPLFQDNKLPGNI